MLRFALSPRRVQRYEKNLSQMKLVEFTNIPLRKISDFKLEKRQPTETVRKALREVLEGDNGISWGLLKLNPF